MAMAGLLPLCLVVRVAARTAVVTAAAEEDGAGVALADAAPTSLVAVAVRAAVAVAAVLRAAAGLESKGASITEQGGAHSCSWPRLAVFAVFLHLKAMIPGELGWSRREEQGWRGKGSAN